MRSIITIAILLPSTVAADPAAKADPPPANDSCRVKVTGGVQREAVGRGGPMAVATSHWEQRDGKRGALFAKFDGAQINCNAPDATITISIEQDLGKFPLGPGRYERKAVKWNEKTPVKVLGTIDKLSFMRSIGVVELTAYDGAHIAGTFKFTGVTLPGDKAITVEGQFDFKCPGLPGCKK